MPWIVAGGLVVSGLLGADASSNAADAQVAASAEQARVQREMFNKQLEVQQPYRAAGYDALNELRSMMSGRYTAYDENGMPVGVGGSTNVNRMNQGGGGRRFVPDVQYVGGGRGATAGLGLRPTVGDSAADAWVRAETQKRGYTSMARSGVTDAQRKQETRDLYDEYYNGSDGGGGYSGQPTGDMLAGSPEDLTGSGYLTKRFNAEDFYNNIDPGYAFRVKEGVRALDRSAAARGGLLGGNQLRGLTELGQNLGSQEYNNAYNRFQTERSNIFNNLAGIAGIGQTSANTVSNAAGNLGNVLGESAINAGNARASGYIGGANAISGALGQGVNYYSQNQMLNRMYPQTPVNNSTSSYWGG